jgi:hypothetical protein
MIWPNFVAGRRKNLALRPVPLSLVKISVLPSRVTCWQLYSRLRSPQFILRQKNPSFQSHSPVTLSPNALPVICPSSKTCNCTRKRGISRVFEPTAATKSDLFITISCAAMKVGMRQGEFIELSDEKASCIPLLQTSAEIIRLAAMLYVGCPFSHSYSGRFIECHCLLGVCG